MFDNVAVFEGISIPNTLDNKPIETNDFVANAKGHCILLLSDLGVIQSLFEGCHANAMPILDRLGSPSVTCEGEQVFLKGF